nr:ribonucleoside-diphosphate reductase large subunit-like [Aegilops tauschii subsp. strangulata]
MYVVKQEGRTETVHFDKITVQLKKLSYGLSQEHCDPVLVAQTVCVEGGTIMGKPIEDVKKLLDDMQENHAQWHVERTTTKRMNAMEESSMELTTKLEELISVMKGKEEVLEGRSKNMEAQIAKIA